MLNKLFLTLVAGLILAGPAQAALHDRGGGLLYDDVLKVTWLQDANYAKTSGASADGKMSWSDAVAWLDKLVYHDPVRNKDLRGWRMPKVLPIGAAYNNQFKMDGSTDEGYNILSPNAELSYMYYVNLGLDGWWTKDGKHPKSFGVLRTWTAMWSGQADVGPVKNLQSGIYWCGNPAAHFPSPAVWMFVTSEGNQRDGLPRPNSDSVWPVRDGDVTDPDPAPAAQRPAAENLAAASETKKDLIGPSHLHDRGGGLLYDDVLKVTWLQDANYAKTSGYKADGKLNYEGAEKFVANLVYHDPVRNQDLRGWRLPRVRPVAGASFNGAFSLNGSTDEGYNITSPNSELAHMFYTNLGLKGYYAPDGKQQTDCGATGTGKTGAANVGLVKNFRANVYWTGTLAEPYTDRNSWMFDAQFGFQNFYNHGDMYYVWPVRDGDVPGAPPMPKGGAQAAIAGPVKYPAPVVIADSAEKEMATFISTLAGVPCEIPHIASIKPDDYDRMNARITEVVKTPGLVALWTFAEGAGQVRRSILASARLPLFEVGGQIPRVETGPFSGYSAQLDGKHYFHIPRAQMGALEISGKQAQVSMLAVARVDEMEKWGGTIAGIWSEGKGINDDTGTRQYALLFNMPAYGGARQLTPHISSEGGVSRRADGSALPWCVDYAASRSEIPVGKWVTLGFTYDGQFIRAYVNGVMEERALDPVKDKRTDPYFTKEGPGGGDRGMNPYYHGRGIFGYNPKLHAKSKPGGAAEFTVGARYAGGNMLGEALKGRIGGLAVFNRALTDADMKRLHDVIDIDALNKNP